MTGEGEGHVWERVSLLTLHGILTVESLLSANLFVPSLFQFLIRTKTTNNTYKSSAKVDGRAIKEVPVSRIIPVLSSSAVASPNVIASRSTSQYALRLNGILVILPV